MHDLSKVIRWHITFKNADFFTALFSLDQSTDLPFKSLRTCACGVVKVIAVFER